MKLLQNSISIKTSQKTNSIDKLKSIVLIQLKVLYKYEDFMTIIFSQLWGNEPRNIECKKYVVQYLKIIEEIIQDGINKGEIIKADPETIASEIFSTTCISLIYRIKKDTKISINDLYKELENILFNGLLK